MRNCHGHLPFWSPDLPETISKGQPQCVHRRRLSGLVGESRQFVVSRDDWKEFSAASALRIRRFGWERLEPMEHVHRSLMIIDNLLGSKKVSRVQTSPRLPRVATLLRGLPFLSVASSPPLRPGRPFMTLFMSPSESTALPSNCWCYCADLDVPSIPEYQNRLRPPKRFGGGVGQIDLRTVGKTERGLE